MGRQEEGTYVEVHGPGKLGGVRQDLTTLPCCQGGERSRVESRVLEAQASVHTVGRELERLLLDVVLEVSRGVQRTVFHERFDLSTPVHERCDETWEYAERDVFAGWFGDLLFALLQPKSASSRNMSAK